MYKPIEKFSMGVGDRFGLEGEAQLEALVQARRQGISVVPVWNKSFREHEITGTQPASVREEADAAVNALSWESSYYVDADHISLSNVDSFIENADFFTLDVADFIGEDCGDDEKEKFVEENKKHIGTFNIPGIEDSLTLSEDNLRDFASQYLRAIQEAGRLYRYIVKNRGDDSFVTEVSMDETDTSQKPMDIFLCLLALSSEGVPAQTIAPKFSGEFYKGVDYVGDVNCFEEEFRQDVAITRFAIGYCDLPETLKVSMHSGSDKFSLYPVMRNILKEFDAGVHLKTAGTTWLEEIGGLASAGGEALDFAKRLYREALTRYDELCAPYASVLDINKEKLPPAEDVEGWTSGDFVGALEHNPECNDYNPDFRQLLHVAYKLAAEAGEEFRSTVRQSEDAVHQKVRDNLLERHIKPLFPED